MSRYAALNGLLIKNDLRTITASQDNEVLIKDLTEKNTALEARVLTLETQMQQIIDLINSTNNLPLPS